MIRAEAFERARERLLPVWRSHGFKLASVERSERDSENAYAEYFRRGVRLRLVWEANEPALWIESAREIDAQIVSRWTDIEWSLAGSPLPLDTEVSTERVERLATALERFLTAP
ncbi:MAG TPA: hypothetical protein VGA78_17020 [Gemmatimonadales bacterium]|jgi:hypothetical protein